MKIKQCVTCDTSKTEDQYYGNSNQCKECKKAYQKTRPVTAARLTKMRDYSGSYERASYYRKQQQWRKDALIRTGGTCAFCKNGVQPTNIYRLLPDYNFPELRFNPNNTIVLCDSCNEKYKSHISVNMGIYN